MSRKYYLNPSEMELSSPPKVKTAKFARDFRSDISEGFGNVDVSYHNDPIRQILSSRVAVYEKCIESEANDLTESVCLLVDDKPVFIYSGNSGKNSNGNLPTRISESMTSMISRVNKLGGSHRLKVTKHFILPKGIKYERLRRNAIGEYYGNPFEAAPWAGEGLPSVAERLHNDNQE